MACEKIRESNLYKAYLLTGIIIIAVWFPSIWFIDSFFALVGGRPVKLITWGTVLLFTAAITIYIRWLKPRLSVNNVIVIMLAVFASVYVFVYNLAMPPPYNYQQVISLCLLVPVSMLLGVSCRGSTPGFFLALLGGSVALLIIITLFSGRASLLSDEFQSYRPISTAEEASNTGYQGLSLMAGFLPVYLVTTLNREQRFGVARMCLMLAAVVPVLLIGGRSAIVALCVVLTFWILANITTSKRHRLYGAALVSSVVVVGLIAVVFLQHLPLGLQRLLSLQDASFVQSSMRIDLWTRALELWLSSPQTILLGVGPQRFPVVSGYDLPGMYPHNFIIEILAEYGIIGFLILLLPIWAALVLGSRRTGKSIRTSHAFYFFVYYFIVALFSGGLQSIWPLFFLAGWFVSERAAQ